MQLVFTYGTLRPSLYPRVVDRFSVTPRGPATLFAPLQMVNLGAYPALVPALSIDTQPIKGELVEVHTLEALDAYEGYRPDGKGLYTRSRLTVKTETGSETAWVYTMTARRGDPPVVETGDWADVVRDRGGL